MEIQINRNRLAMKLHIYIMIHVTSRTHSWRESNIFTWIHGFPFHKSSILVGLCFFFKWPRSDFRANCSWCCGDSHAQKNNGKDVTCHTEINMEVTVSVYIFYFISLCGKICEQMTKSTKTTASFLIMAFLVACVGAESEPWVVALYHELLHRDNFQVVTGYFNYIIELWM